MPLNIYELEGRLSAVIGGASIGKAVYEGAISFVESMGSIDPMLHRPHTDAACFYGLLFLAAVGGIIHASSHSNHVIDGQAGQGYPNVNA